jgi:outer membrane lipoprotein LolB
MKLISWLSIAVLSMLLSACVTRPAVTPPLSIAYTLPDTFTLTGRASIKYQGGGDYIRFTWQVNKAQTTISLNSPIGTRVAEIVMTPDQAMLRKGQDVWQAADAETLMDTLLKWHFPVKGLHYWILGLAAPDSSAHWQSKAHGWHLTQAGWQLYFSQYVQIEEHALARVPKRIEATGQELAIKIMIDTWDMGKRDE